MSAAEALVNTEAFGGVESESVRAVVWEVA